MQGAAKEDKNSAASSKRRKECKDTSGSSIVEEKTLRRSEDGGEITFVVIQKNVTSLCSSDRVEELAREVCDCRWDALMISESW